MPANLFNDSLRELSLAIQPLSRIDSAPKTTDLLRKLGYELPGSQQFAQLPVALPQRVITLVEHLNELFSVPDEEKIGKAIAVGGDIKAIIGEFEPLIEVFRSGAPGNFLANSHIDELPRRLLDFLVSEYAEAFHSGPHSFMLLLGIFDEIDLPADAAHFQPAFTLKKVWWERLPDYVTNPKKVANDVYNWEADFNSDLFLTRLERILRGYMLPGGLYTQNPVIQAALGNAAGAKEIRMPIFQSGNSPDLFSQFGLLLSPVAPAGGKPKGLGLMPYMTGVANAAFNLNETLTIEFRSTASIDNGVGLILRPVAQLEVLDTLFTAPQNVGDLSIRLSLKKKNTEETILIGTPNGSRLSIKGFETAVFATKRGNTTDFGLELGIVELKVVIGTEGADGFLGSVLSAVRLEATFDLGIAVSAAGGVSFRGSANLEIPFPTHITLGPVEIQELRLGIRPQADRIPITAGATIKLALGPFTAVVQNMGLELAILIPQGNNFSGTQLKPGFKPPTGIGLSLDTPVVRGAGFLLFDPDNEQYAGALELSIRDTIQVTAIALITTKFPDGSKGFSLLLIVSVTFTPGIVLGMGFFLSGLGGMIGINRTINTDALRDSVKTNAIASIMFPQNIIQNIVQIINDIRTIFPPKRDQFMIGFMARITWGVPSLVTIDFGLIIEFASPVRVAILGVLKIVIPTEDAALIRIQVNFLGLLDFEKGELSFDASLFNSRILLFTLEGDMALRLSWGVEKAFLLSVGGFHPAFEPPARLKVSNMKRLTLNILSPNPRLVLTTYFAVTSNTVQFGANADLKFEVAGFSIVGYLGFDVLFQFSPFMFIANIRAGVAIKLGGATLFSIHLELELRGPTPWIAKGTGSFSILFFEISVSFTIKWGEEQQISLPDVQVLPRLVEALQQARNWKVELPNNRFSLVSLRDLSNVPPEQLILQPLGALSITQTILPLNTNLDKFGNANPEDVLRATISGLFVNKTEVTRDDVTEAFAPAQFKNLSDNDKLTSPSFKREVSGVRLHETDRMVVNYAINRLVEYEVRVSDYDPESEKPYLLYIPIRFSGQSYRADWFGMMMAGGAIGKSALSKENKVKQSASKAAFRIDDEQFTLVDTQTLRPIEAALTGGSRAQTDDHLTRILAEKPDLFGKIRAVAVDQI